MYVSVCVCVRVCKHTSFSFLHGWFLGTPEPLLWNKAYHWCSSVLLVCVCVCVFIVFHGHVCDMLMFMA